LDSLKTVRFFRLFLDETEAGLKRAYEILAAGNCSGSEINELFRITHTIKGSGASLDLFPLIESAHEFENLMAELRDKGRIESPEEIKEKYQALEQILEEIKNKLNKLGGKQADVKIFEGWEYDKLKKLIRDKNSGEALHLLNSVNNPSLSFFVHSKAQAVFDQTMQSVNKKAVLHIESENRRITPDFLKILEVVLPHVIRNSLDHGLEGEAERIESGKPETGFIKVKAKSEKGYLLLEVEDDGAGIQPDQLAAAAVEKGVITEDEFLSLSDQKKQELVFAPGFSTSAEVSNISGRGVGLDSVKLKVENAGGKINLYSEVGKGTKFRFEIPLN